jgi:PhnB protein
MPAVIPYITVSNAAEAMDFYKKAFSANENARMGEPDGKKRIFHGDMTVKGGSVFVMDVFAEHAGTDGCGSVAAPSPAKPSAASMVLQCASPAEVDAGYQQAIDAGCINISKPEDTFWNARFAAVCDPYGHIWMFNADLPKKN